MTHVFQSATMMSLPQMHTLMEGLLTIPNRDLVLNEMRPTSSVKNSRNTCGTSLSISAWGVLAPCGASWS